MVPAEFLIEFEQGENPIFKNGNKILGSIHSHTSGNPPSPMDFSIMLHSDEERNYGVLTGTSLFLFVQSAETPKLEIEPISAGETTLSDFAKTLESEVVNLQNEGISLHDARMQVLMAQCKEYNVAFYYGDLQKNNLQRIA